jgi:hypothetical protein
MKHVEGEDDNWGNSLTHEKIEVLRIHLQRKEEKKKKKEKKMREIIQNCIGIWWWELAKGKN